MLNSTGLVRIRAPAPQTKLDCIHCEPVMTSIRRQLETAIITDQNTFYGFHSGNEAQYETECPWPAVCNVIVIRTHTLQLVANVDQAS